MLCPAHPLLGRTRHSLLGLLHELHLTGISISLPSDPSSPSPPTAPGLPLYIPPYCIKPAPGFSYLQLPSPHPTFYPLNLKIFSLRQPVPILIPTSYLLHYLLKMSSLNGALSKNSTQGVAWTTLVGTALPCPALSQILLGLPAALRLTKSDSLECLNVIFLAQTELERQRKYREKIQYQ